MSDGWNEQDTAIISAYEAELHGDEDREDDLALFIHGRTASKIGQFWTLPANERSYVVSIPPADEITWYSSPRSQKLSSSHSIAAQVLRSLSARALAERTNSTDSRLIEPAWIAGFASERETIQAKTDLEYIMTRLERNMTRRQAKIWMQSHNRRMDGRPVDVARIRSVAEVLSAIEALEQLAY